MSISSGKKKTNSTPSALYMRLRNLVLFLLICILIAGVVSLMAQYQFESNAIRTQIESQR